MIHGSKIFFGGLHAITILRWLQWKKNFSKILIFSGTLPTLKFWVFLTIFPKLRGRKISKFRFMGQFLTLKNMVTKFFQNSNFSDFLGIKSEISHLDKIKLNSQIFGNFWNLETDRFWVCSRVLEPKYCESIRSLYKLSLNSVTATDYQRGNHW